MSKSFVPLALLLAVNSFAQLGEGATLRSLYVQDQRDRGVALAEDGISMLPKEQAAKLPSYDWDKEVPQRDEARREQARTLLTKPHHSGEDYYYAAFLFSTARKPMIPSLQGEAWRPATVEGMCVRAGCLMI